MSSMFKDWHDQVRYTVSRSYSPIQNKYKYRRLSVIKIVAIGFKYISIRFCVPPPPPPRHPTWRAESIPGLQFTNALFVSRNLDSKPTSPQPKENNLRRTGCVQQAHHCRWFHLSETYAETLGLSSSIPILWASNIAQGVKGLTWARKSSRESLYCQLSRRGWGGGAATNLESGVAIPHSLAVRTLLFTVYLSWDTMGVCISHRVLSGTKLVMGHNIHITIYCTVWLLKHSFRQCKCQQSLRVPRLVCLHFNDTVLTVTDLQS